MLLFNNACQIETYTTVYKFGVGKFFFFWNKSVKSIKIYKISNIVKYDYNKIILYCNILNYNLFLMVKLNFPQLYSSVTHDPSEIILICWFAAQETTYYQFKTVSNFCY